VAYSIPKSTFPGSRNASVTSKISSDEWHTSYKSCKQPFQTWKTDFFMNCSQYFGHFCWIKPWIHTCTDTLAHAVQVTNASDTHLGNLYQNLLQETCSRNLHDVTGWFLSCARHCLSWNRAVLSCMQGTCTRKNLYKIDRHMCKFLVQDDLHKWLAPPEIPVHPRSMLFHRLYGFLTPGKT